MKRFSAILIILILCMSLIPVSISAATTLEIGDTVTLYTSDAYPSYSPTGNVSRSYMWSTSNSNVIKIVSKNGNMCVVQAVGPGTAYVENTQSMSYTYYDPILGSMPGYETGFGDSYSFKVELPPTAVSLPATLNVYANGSGSLSVTYTPSNASSTLSWKSSNTSVATVSEGIVYGIKPGTATITVTTENGLSDTCKVTVTARDLKLSSSSPSDGSVNVAKNKKIVFTFNDDIEKGTKYSSVSLKDTTDNKTVTIEKEITDNKLTITPAELKAGHTYTATVPEKAVKSVFGKNLTEAAEVAFTVKNLNLTGVTPEDGAENIEIAGMDIVFNFEEEVIEGENFDNIVVTEVSGEKLTTAALTYGKSLIVLPLGLEYDTEYMVTVPIGAIKNADGFPQTEEYSITFWTKPGPLEITDSDIKDGDKNVNPKLDMDIIYFYFNYFVFKGENFSDICILNNDTNEAVDMYKYASNGSKRMYIQPYEDLKPGCSYTIKIPKGALENAVGEGIKKTSIHFTTASGGSATVPEIEFDGKRVTIDGGNCYYTTDGSDPELYGVLYEEPFEVERISTLVRAVSFESGIISEEASLLCETPIVKVKDKSVFGGEENDQFYAVAACEYGYVAVGEADKYSFDTARWTDVYSKGGWTDAIIVRYDEDGYVDWKANYGSSGYDEFSAVIEDSDNSIVAVGSKGSAAVIVKYTDYGDMEWSDSVNYGSFMNFYDVCEATDGYVATGYSYMDGVRNGIIVKYSYDGTIVWEKNNEAPFWSVAAVDDGFIATGCTETDGYDYPIIVKYDTEGNVIWEKTYTDFDDCFYDVAVDSTGIVVTNDDTIVKLDHEGDMLWSHCADADYSYDDICADEGGYVAVGEDGYDAVIVKYTKDGELILNETFGSTKTDCFTGIDKTQNGYIVAGHSSAGGFNRNDWEDCYGYGGIDATVVEYEYMPEESDSDACDKSASLKELVIKGKEYISRRTRYEAIAFPSVAEIENVRWSVDDEDMATIDENGYLTPRETGWVTVTAEAEGLEAEIDVYVTYTSGTKLIVDTKNIDNGLQFDVSCCDEIAGATLVVAIYNADNSLAKVVRFHDVSFLDEEDVFSVTGTNLQSEGYIKFMIMDSDNLEPLAESRIIDLGA